jgi:DNA polymerase-3 subunit alpha
VKFVSLHHHTTFSYMDGFGTPAQHVERAVELEMNALAFTEHGNVSSHPQAEKAAKKVGIKPIFGLEAYTHPDPKSRRKFHLTILASNATGYANLMRIVSRSWAEGFYQWPTVSGQMLADHHEGLIILSGCSDSLLACSLLGGKTIEPADASVERATRQAASFRALLGDRFYLECQAFPEFDRTRAINAAYEEIGRKLRIPLVATADVHYPHADDNEMQVILHAAGRGNNDVAKQVESWEYDVRLCHPTSDLHVFDRIRRSGLSKTAAVAAARATAEIAQTCSVTLPKAERIRYPLPSGVTALDAIWDLLRDGWRYRVAQGNDRLIRDSGAYAERVRYEMERISGKDFNDYHLVISDVVRFAKDSGIPVGPARGSAAASLVCYLLRITEIDPLQYPLMFFERYIDPTREDEPDIDLDFDDGRRREVEEYVISKYGSDRVGKICTFTQYKGRSAIDDVARVHRIPKVATERAKEMVVDRSGGDSRADFALADTIEMFPAAKAIFDAHPALYQAIRLEGNYRGMSTHAAGLVITNSPVADTCAMYTRVDGNGVTHTGVSADKKDAEYLGLMKVDLLGLSTMGMLRRALEMAEMTLEELYRVPMTEVETLKAFRRNDVIGIFQLEGRATRVVNQRVKPDSFMEIADVVSLSRPGPLFSGTTSEYVEVKWHGKKPTKFHPIIDALTKDTRGQIIYQEQVLKTLELIGGLPVRRVHEIRRIISQKLGQMNFEVSAKDFVRGAYELHGIPEATARVIWGRVVTSATYAFNVAHAVSYAMLAFWCMFMKVHFPSAFYTAQLQAVDKERWPRLIKDSQTHGVRVRGVTLGVSGRTWKAVNDGEETDAPSLIVAGYEQLPGVGPVTAQKILDHDAALARVHGFGLSSVEELLDVSGIGEKTVEKFAQLLDTDDPFGLQKVARLLDEARGLIDTGRLALREPTHRSNAIVDLPQGTVIRWLGFVKKKDYKDFIEDERARTGETFEEIRSRIPSPDLTTSCFMHCYDDEDEDVYVRVYRTGYPEFQRRIESIRPNHDLIFVEGRKSRGVFGANIYIKQLYIIDPEA